MNAPTEHHPAHRTPETPAANNPRLRRAGLAWLLVLVLGVAAAVITISAVNASQYGPKKPVQEYLAALKAGDGGKALGLSHAKVPAGSAALMNGEVLKKAESGMGDESVGAPVKQTNGHVKIPVTFTVGGAKHTSTFELAPAGRSWLFFQRWEMVPGSLPMLDVSVVNNNQAQINGATVNLPEGKNQFAAFYPAVYTASLNTKNFTAAQQQAVVDSASAESVNLATQPSKQLTDTVNSQLKDFLDKCATQDVLLPTGCPLSASTSNRVIPPVKWTITNYPQAKITAYNGGWAVAPLSVTAKVSYKQQDSFSGQFSDFAKQQDFGFSATLDASNDQVTVTPVVQY